MQRILNIIIFDEIVITYVRNKNLFDKIEQNVESMKYENQFKLNENERAFY